MARKTAASTKTKPVELSDKQIVLNVHKNAKCYEPSKGLFHICVKSKNKVQHLHSRLAKNESNAWKLAAHNVLTGR